MTTWHWILVGFGIWLVTALALGLVLGRLLREKRVTRMDVLRSESPTSAGASSRQTGELPAPRDGDADEDALAEHRTRRE
ncbi:hypothetical protein PHK61_26460 [Actinomycetospora lutea]|uniref:hypothetical protein n=1 Tax=Actinomycetospora lutea TaxID=663604 RepID=UPI002365A79E|nr:hypothetical protein [Actinomycetospora lutea]MDD7941963.1 hypothetical protein [Actinomycetospora lutea]